MSERSNIEWTDATWNPIRGCSKVSPGCKYCYAMGFAARFSGPGQPYEGLAVMKSDGPHWTGKVRLIESVLDLPLRWRKPRRIFVNSMSDLFHESVSVEDICRIFEVMGRAKQHTFQVLTKRPARMAGVLQDISCFGGDPPSHIWWGISAEDQPTADERIPLLLQTPAAVRWVSYEPALGPVNFAAKHENYLAPGGLDWLVIGGESGPHARPFDVQWARDVVAQCKVAGVPCFVKQLGAHVITDGITGPGQHWPFGTKRVDTGEGHFHVRLHDRKGGDMAEWPEDLRVREFPVAGEAAAMKAETETVQVTCPECAAMLDTQVPPWAELATIECPCCGQISAIDLRGLRA